MIDESLTWTVLPTFSRPIGNAVINDSYAMVMRDKLSEFEFLQTVSNSRDDGNSHKSYISKSLYVLDEMPEVRDYLGKVVANYIVDALGYDCDIKITTSWFTKILPGGYCQYHTHSNCWYSCVVYFDDNYDEKCGDLVFWNDDNFFEIALHHDTIFNTTVLPCPPSKNSVIIFPASTKHRVSKNNSSSIRYSLAFNINPSGIVGYSDNTLHI
jgi:uncharacterized protein (TIGR02466 family)